MLLQNFSLLRPVVHKIQAKTHKNTGISLLRHKSGKWGNSAHPIRANRAHPSYFVAANFPQNIGGQAYPRPQKPIAESTAETQTGYCGVAIQ